MTSRDTDAGTMTAIPQGLQNLLGGLGDAGVSDDTQGAIAGADLSEAECEALLQALGLGDDDDED